jgi:hypothetical protein
MLSLIKNFRTLLNGLKAKFSLPGKHIAIVYYVYINPAKDWQQFVREQLNDLQKTGVLAAADLYIVVANPNGAHGVAAFFNTFKHVYTDIEFRAENKFEYWGIARVWQLAQDRPQYNYFSYFHTKGMSYPEAGRVKIEQALTYYTFKDWRFFIKLFEQQASMNKIGLFPALKVNKKGKVRGGWIWYNFWWARADYLRALEPPQFAPKHRYYYEEWLSYLRLDTDAKYTDSWSSYSQIQAVYNNEEVLEHTELLIAAYETKVEALAS